MAKVVTDNKYYTEIANTIRALTYEDSRTELFFTAGLASAIRSACRYNQETGEQAGYERGFAEGNETGKEYGKQAEYDRFWDAYQQNGNRTYYVRAFTIAWTDEILKPKYTAKPIKADYMFYESGIVNALANPEWLDLTQCTSAENLARFATKMTECSLHIPVCAYFDNGVRDCTDLTKLTLTGIIETCRFVAAFTNCTKLTDVTLGGTIGKDISFQWSPLSVESMKSIILGLKNYAGTDSEYTYTLTFNDDCWAALLADGTTAPDGSAWDVYASEVKCWNI